MRFVATRDNPFGEQRRDLMVVLDNQNFHSPETILGRLNQNIREKTSSPSA